MASDAERLRVYLYCRPIFTGDKAKLRRAKKITELVRMKEGALAPLLHDIGEGKLVAVARDLLEGRVFESELRAKVEFPDLFRPSPSRDAHRQVSEIEAAQSAAEALDEVASQDSGNPDPEEADAPCEMGRPGAPEEGPKAEEKENGVISTARDSVVEKMPSLYPSYLPYQTQHSILTTAQQVLEECCFEFAINSMPAILKQKGWDCPAAGELTEWVKVLRRQKGNPDVASFLNGPGSTGTNALFQKVCTLRHTAVHRVPTTARGITNLLGSAVKLSRLLQDEQRAEQLDDIRLELDSQIGAMELNKNALEDSVTTELREIQRQREELDRREAELIDGMVDNDLRNKVFVGQLLEEYVKDTFEKGKRAMFSNGFGEDTDDPGTKESFEEGGRGEDEGEANGMNIPNGVKTKLNHRQKYDYDYPDLDKLTAGIWTQ